MQTNDSTRELQPCECRLCECDRREFEPHVGVCAKCADEMCREETEAMKTPNPGIAAICAMWGLPAEGATLTFRGMWDLDAGNRRICFAEGGSGGRNWMPVPGLAGLRGDQGEEAARRIRFHLDNPHHRHKDGGRCWDPACGRARLITVRGPRDVVMDVLDERARQNAQWGEQNHPDGTGAWDGHALEQRARDILADSPTFAAILMEEVGEALQEKDPERLRAELVQVVAVGVQWIEAIDRRKS